MIGDAGPVTRVPLPVRGRAITVFGCRGPAAGVIVDLVEAGATVTVVADTVDPVVARLAERGQLDWRRRRYVPDDLSDPWLVYTATEIPEEDARIEADAEQRRLWCVRLATPAPPEEGLTQTGSGRVTLVSGGPGDAALMTQAGLNTLREADVVLVDRLAAHDLLDHAPPDAEVIDVGKRPHGPATSQNEINELLVRHARQGQHVVRLKGGDSLLFGRGGEEALACGAAGVDVRVVPGVSSALAAPAVAGIPITHRGLTQGVTVVSGHVPPGHADSAVDYSALARAGNTIVLMMAMAHLDRITLALCEGGLSSTTPAATIAAAGTRAQQVVRGTVADIADLVRTAGVSPPAVTVIGTVAALDITESGSGRERDDDVLWERHTARRP